MTLRTAHPGYLFLLLLLIYSFPLLQSKFQKEERLLISADEHFSRTITIGAPISFDISDAHATSGSKMKHGWTMFTEWVNNRGGIKLHGENVSITLVCVEDYSNVTYVEDAVEYLLTFDSPIDFFLAPYSSLLSKTASSITDPLGKLLMAGAASNENVYLGSNHTFGTTGPSRLYVESAFRSLSTFQARRVAVLRDNDEPMCMSDTVLEVSADSSVELYGYYELDPKSPEYEEQVEAILTELKAEGVDSVLGCSYEDLCIQIPSISKNIDYNPDGMLFIICDVVEEVRDALGVDADYLLGVIPWVPTVNTVDEYVGWTSQEFQSRFEEQFDVNPTTVGASAFAGIEILVSTIEAVQSLDVHVIEEALLSSVYSTFYSNMTFDENHQANMVLLVWQLRWNNSEFIMDIIVDPPDKATAEVVWPAPTWSQRECTRDTSSCSSHGSCDAAGVCVCDYLYYSSDSTTPCDSYCDGEIADDTGKCHSNKVFYIGGLVDYSAINGEEFIATMRFAVDMINNYTDGWFDSTRQVRLELEVADSQCSQVGGDSAARLLNDWAINSSSRGTSLDGFIGASCSDGSVGSARFGNSIFASQISFGSTSNILSDKDEYTYFARTCFADDSQGELLVDVLEDIGLVPFIAVIATTDSYAQSLSVSIIDSYEAKGHIVLSSFSYTPAVNSSTEDYMLILDQLAASGSPVTVLVMYAEEVVKLMTAASLHPVFMQDEMVWVGIEMWINVDGLWNKKGMVGLKPYTPTVNLTSSYIDLWGSLDPEQYHDSDGDRTTLGSNTLFVADAVFALALAFQMSTDGGTGGGDDALKQQIYSFLTQEVTFTGVSGPVDLLSDGNRDNPVFGIGSFGGVEWTDVGSVNENGTQVEYSSLVWPDNSTGRATTYSQQTLLYCPAGMEPSQTSVSPVIYGCTQCRVGSYSPDASTSTCLPCPEGTDCNDVGIQIPCISKGYWRAEPTSSDDLGDFGKYPVYSCDIPEGCISGCVLNSTCAEGREGTSVTCGVCLEGYYLNNRGSCVECKEDEIFTPANVLVLYVCVFLVIGGLFFVLLQVFAAKEIKAVAESGPTTSGGDTSAGGTAASETERETLSRQSMWTSSIRIDSVMSVAKTKAMSLFSRQNVRDVMVTSKIVLAFFQVMSSFFILDLGDISSAFEDFSHSYNVNPFRGNEDIVGCSTISDEIPAYYFIVLNCFFFPIVVVGMFGCIAASVYHFHRLQLVRRCREAAPHQRPIRLSIIQQYRLSNLSTQVLTILSRVVLWLCLVFYPSICSLVLSVFNCRDFATSGVWLRVDNEISCEDDSYSAYLVLASAGVALYVVGIPLLFFYAIKNRHLRIWFFSSRFLYHGFVDKWKYYEIVDLTRKLLITSVSQFVASPSSSSQVLFMIMVNVSALYLLAKATPYMHPNDNNLSTLLTSIECIAFTFALLIISGISETEGFSEARIFNALIALLIVGVGVMTPYTFMTKIDFCNRKMDEAKGFFNKYFAACFPQIHFLPELSPSSQPIGEELKHGVGCEMTAPERGDTLSPLQEHRDESTADGGGDQKGEGEYGTDS